MDSSNRLHTALSADMREGAARAQERLEQLDRWLSNKDIPIPEDQPDVPRVRRGLGIHHIKAASALTLSKES